MCIYGHNPDRHDQSTTFEFVGENLALTTAGAVDYVSLVQAWYDEVNDYTYSTMECAPGKACGHYTQVLTCSRLQWDLWWCHAGCLGNVKAYRVWCYQMCWNQSFHGCFVFRVQLWSFVSQLAWIWVCFICFLCVHRGNIAGEFPYASGDSCSACPTDLPLCMQNLCCKLVLHSMEPLTKNSLNKGHPIAIALTQEHFPSFPSHSFTFIQIPPQILKDCSNFI